MKKIIELDVFKGIAAVMVIIIHVTATPVTTLEPGSVTAVLSVFNRFSKPSVPMFIFASGFALYYVYDHIEFKYPEFLSQRFSRVLIPYICWSIVYFLWNTRLGVYPFSINFFMINLFNGKMMYHLYYIIVIIQFYILFFLFFKLTNILSAKIAIPISFALNLIAIIYTPSILYGRSFTTFIFYFVLGCFAGKHAEVFPETIKRYKNPIGLAFLISGIFYTWQFITYELAGTTGKGIYDSLGFMAISISGICFIYYICIRITEGDSWIKNALLKLSDGSFYIYLSHPLAISVAAVIAVRLGIEDTIGQMLWAIMFIFITSVPFSIAYIEVKRYGKL